MMASPFLIQGPALISFSGGRTSARMLWEILNAHGGVMPDDIAVIFANTGKEHPATLRFVHECSVRWSVGIHWVEWRRGGEGFEQVGFNSASRNGEPFAALMEQKQRVPNWQERWCTQYLKVLPTHALMRHLFNLEPGGYEEIIGLREDEWDRRISGLTRAAKDGRCVSYPLSDAGIRKPHIFAFWAQQPFDLDLPRGMGNCTHCFAMGRAERISRLRFNPDDAPWWINFEERVGRFDRRDSVTALLAEAQRAPTFFEGRDADEWECGLSGCGGWA